MKQIKNQQKRNKFEKILIFIIGLLLCFSLAIFVTFFIKYENKFAEKDITIPCNTKECVKLSATIMNYINPKINPCDDFYNFTCGNFITSEHHSTPFQELQKTSEKLINHIISEKLEGPLPQPLILQRKFYKKCLNLTEIEEDNDNTLINLLQKLDLWPILYGGLWDETKFNWFSATARSRELGLPYKMFISITFKYPQNSENLLLLSVSIISIYVQTIFNKKMF